MWAKILLVEDNLEISNNIKKYLELEDYIVETSFTWGDALDKALWEKYDLILLDLMLPEIDWYRIAEKVWRKTQTPIIMVTAKDSIEDKIKWFEIWALDYIVKPFDLRELELRIKSILWRNKKAPIFSQWDIEIDLKKRIFTKSGNEVHLTQKEFLIVEMLLNNNWRPVTRTDLIEVIWWIDKIYEWDAKLDVYISNIRKKLSHDLIKTIKLVGYKI